MSRAHLWYLPIFVAGLLACAPAASASIAFEPRTDYSTGLFPETVAIGDLNGDGTVDVLTGSSWFPTVSEFDGNGDGTLGARSDFAAGGTVWNLALADFNGDGNLDAAATHFLDNSVSVLLGDGAGGFGSPTTFPSGGANSGGDTYGVATADFNNDGNPDIAVANLNSGTVGFLFGDGAGGMSAPSLYSAYEAYRLAAGDLTGDGVADLVKVGSNQVDVFLADSQGGFSTRSFFGGYGNNGPAIADFNGDGNADLVVSNGGSASMTLFTGDGAGNFAQSAVATVDPFPAAGAAADFDDDGHVDAATTLPFSNAVDVVAGDGQGGLGAVTQVAVQAWPSDVRAADMNGDGIPDLVVTNHDSHSVSVILASVSASDTTPPELTLPDDITVTATGAAGAVVTYTASATDDTDPSPSLSCDPESGATFAIGTTTVDCVATDKSGNTARGSFEVQVTYDFSGFLQPINSNDSSVFKAGSTVPVKFALTYADGSVVSTASATFSYTFASSSGVGPVNETVSSASPTPGDSFRYDSTAKQYIFNWRTTGLTPGVYDLDVRIDDGTDREVTVSLK